MTNARCLLIIEYGIEDFAEDHPNLTGDQLKEVLGTLERDMDYSMIDEHIRGEFYDLAEKMYPTGE